MSSRCQFQEKDDLKLEKLVGKRGRSMSSMRDSKPSSQLSPSLFHAPSHSCNPFNSKSSICQNETGLESTLTFPLSTRKTIHSFLLEQGAQLTLSTLKQWILALPRAWKMMFRSCCLGLPAHSLSICLSAVDSSWSIDFRKTQELNLDWVKIDLERQERVNINLGGESCCSLTFWYDSE